jgi:hypothetical protein
MADSLPPVGEFARQFNEFMRAMAEAADSPESALLRRLREHLGDAPEQMPVNSTSFGVADRPNLQLALDAVLGDRETIGVFNPHRHHMGIGFSQLVSQWRGRFDTTQPVEYEDVELGDGRVIRCIVSALILVRWNGAPVALILSNEQGPPYGHIVIRLEAISPDPEAVSAVFGALRAAMLEHNVFRGKVVSLGLGGRVTFPTIPTIRRDAVVLPDGTIERLERHAIGITEQSDALRRAGRHLKRGVLMHGPPGTGKTLTINYLLTAMAGRTTVILTGQALGMVEQAFGIARDLAPATVVLEDVDLVAEERTMPGGHGPLFELLNELEGLAEDADLLVLLTTNRADLIEPALAARPGRVDLAQELPLPDDEGRRRLLRLYAEEIQLDSESEQQLVERSKGATGALIKELMRQATLHAALRGAPATAADVLSILGELFEDRGALTRRLLGQPDENGPTPQPSQSMLRAITASGLPLPPDIQTYP